MALVPLEDTRVPLSLSRLQVRKRALIRNPARQLSGTGRVSACCLSVPACSTLLQQLKMIRITGLFSRESRESGQGRESPSLAL
jgi:hypothetical protein